MCPTYVAQAEVAPARPAMFSRILVPTDFSEGSEAAWQMAQQLASVHGAELLLLHVVSGEDLLRSLESDEQAADEHARHTASQLNIANTTPPEDVTTSARQWAERHFEQWGGQAREAGLTFRTLLRRGDPPREIAAVVRDERIDLVVVASHRRGGIDRFIKGSVSDRVARTAPCPVLVVRYAFS